MRKKKHERSKLAAAAAPELPIAAETPQRPAPPPIAPLRMRLGTGRYAVKAAEMEIRIDGTRLTGGNGIVEFDLYDETWLDIVVIRA